MQKRIIRLLAVTGLILLVPIIASQFVEGWNWGLYDYIFAFLMIFGTGSLFEWGLSMGKGNISYGTGFGLALLGGFMIIWGNLAVGFIGSEDNPVNGLYFLVLAIAFFGAIIARFQASAMARIMYGTGLGIALVPVIALIMKSNFQDIPESVGTFGVFILNMFFVVMFIGSGLLFRNAALDEQLPNKTA